MTYLEEVHKRALEIQKEIDLFCVKNDIPYFLIGGSLLGAVRHQGFIPWDDDIDIGMLRKDYEKFMSLWKDTENYELLEYRKQKDFSRPQAKISDKHSKIKVWSSRDDDDYQMGVFVDIFPIDIVSDDFQRVGKTYSKIKRYITILNNRKLSRIASPKDMPFIQKISLLTFKTIAFVMYKILGRKYLINKIYKLSTESSGNYIINFSTSYKFTQELFPLEYVDKIIQHKFESESFPIPAEYNKMLEIQYGPDYMKIPDNINPNTHHGFDYLEIDDIEYIVDGKLI
ncbi:phosphorylcholine transferase LicD [Lactococcus nasutitermitis]|uniref:Phosphorylcholine transferase LicD n=1 Tax=Lactococcus nasutitermitis TaxID=1652957 RepID=A0ABV9JE85_9LACT|nr:LicD family protein [Lactococcus nasutitermitis]